MRIAAAALLGAIVVVGSSAADAQKTDPYPWCAEYGGGGFSGGGTNCYFMTWGQCMAAISGNGGFCRRNLFYTGAPNVSRRPRYR